MLEDKVRDVFSDMVVLKNPERTEFFSNLSLPSYMRDWLVMKFSDDDGIIDYDSVLRYIRQYIPSREDFEQFKFEMVNGETVRFLARIRVNVDIKTGKTLFELPDFGGSRSGASGEVANDVVSRWKETQPFPPAPAFTEMRALSIKVVAIEGPFFAATERQGGAPRCFL